MIVESNGNSRIVKKTNSRPNSRILNSRLAPLLHTEEKSSQQLLTLAFLLYDLAVNPDHQEKLFNEIVEVVGERGRVTEAKLKKLRYLKACVKESQRMKPAVQGISRETQQDMVLGGGYQIPSGTVVGVMMMLTMNQEENFDNPHLFRPERWLRGSPTQHTANPFAAMPFGSGPRMCVGRRFAELEIYVAAIKLLQQFRLEYHHEPIGQKIEYLNIPDKKIKMKFVPRC